MVSQEHSITAKPTRELQRSIDSRDYIHFDDPEEGFKWLND
ncbi:hypothetical protein [Lactobacillus sp. ESL0681]|nr:hypothetical protein [Lactobacillus sp. ESL0681]WEV40370.1 hypothetical protein OZX59_00185 [Lactobacillus sp. ESL0681]